MLKKIIESLLQMSATTFLAVYIVTWIFSIWLFAILLPEQFMNNPVVNQFIAMAGNILSFISGFFFAGKKHAGENGSGEEEQNNKLK